MKNQFKPIAFLSLVLLCIQGLAQDSLLPKGKKAPNVHHTGDVWLNHLSAADETFGYSITHVVMAPGAKLNWHYHPAGQQLLVTDGIGLYQEKGKEPIVLRTGDLVTCAPNVEHWHAATPTTEVAYLAFSGNKPTQWTDELTQEAYEAIPIPEADEVVNVEDQLKMLSQQKWKWMADKNVEKLSKLFHDQAVFVHMGGSWGTDRELDIIEGGGIWYKQADVHEASVNVLGNTAILLNRITLIAEVGGREVTNPFEVTEVYVLQDDRWLLGSLSFTKLMER